MPWGVAAAVGGAAIAGAVASDNADKAVSAQKSQNKKNQKFIREMATNARNDAIPLYDAAQQNRGIGVQSAFDSMAQTIPEQGRLMQDGNVAAQEMLLAGLPQANNALLGLPVDYSALQPQRLEPNYDWTKQQVPEFVNPELAQMANPGQAWIDGELTTDPNWHPFKNRPLKPNETILPDGTVKVDTDGSGNFATKNVGKGSLAHKLTGGKFSPF